MRVLHPSIVWLGRLAVAIAVPLMAGWNAYISLRARPDLPTVVLNLAFWFVPMLVPLALTGRLWRSVAFGTAATFVLQRVHWLKWKYFEQTWTLGDFRLASDSTNWIVLRQYPETIWYLALGAVMLLATWFLPPRGVRATGRARLAALGLAAALVTGVVQWRHAHAFDPFGFTMYGHFASLAYSGSSLFYNPPVIEGTSEEFLARAQDVPPGRPTATVRRPDIVVWLQESTMDPMLLEVRGLPALSMYSASAAARAGGLLRVPTWGGATWLSEFALLAGLSSRDFGDSSNGVYYTVTSKLRFTLPKLLKTAGYRAAVLSGSPKGLYNSETAQRQLGFDEVLNPLDFPSWGGKSLADHLISDTQLADYASEVLARPRDQPMLLFVLSIMQHGPYDSAYRLRPGIETGRLGRPLAARLSDYVDRLLATDAANAAMRRRLLAGDTPRVFAYFGDHQPNLDGELPYATQLAAPQFLTSYAITSNIDHVVADPMPPALDIAFLGALILQYAGVPLDRFFDANRSMRLLCNGRLTDCPDTALTKSYRAHIYGDLGAAQQ